MYEILYQLGINAGPQAALIAFFVWQSDRREKRLAGEITKLQDFCGDTLVSMAKENARVVQRNTNALQRLEFAVGDDPEA